MARFDLDQIESYMNDTPAINIALPTGGAYLLQCALSTMDKRWQWVDDGDLLTDEQWDELQEDLAALMLAIITEVEFVSVPIGGIVPFTSLQVGDWIACQGGSYARVDYPLLYAAIHPYYHTDEDYFVTPDLRDRFIQGQSNHGDPDEVGDTGGASTVTLTTLQLPVHSHQIPLKDATGTGSDYPEESGEGSVTGVGDTGTTGLGLAHENRPPYHVLIFMMRAR